MSGVKETDFPFELGVVFDAGRSEVSWPLPPLNLLLIDNVDTSVFTFDFFDFSTFLGLSEGFGSPLAASADLSMLESAFLILVLKSSSSPIS